VAKESGDSKEYKTGKGDSLYILIICTLLYMVNYMDRQVLAAVVEPMKAALSLNDSDIGVLGTVFLLSIALFSFPVAYLVDRWSRRKAIGIMAILWSGFTLLTGKAWSFWTLLIPRALVGVGEAGFSSGGTAMVGAAYPSKKRGAVMGVFNMAIPLGVALGSVLGGMLAKLHGWQAPFLVFAIPGVILGILAFFMKDYKTVQHTHESGAKVTFFQSTKKLFKIPSLVWVLVGYGLANIMSMSFLFWTPAYIGRAWGVDVAAANAVMVPIVLAAIVGSPVGGILADVWFKKNPRGRLYLPAITIMLSAVCMAGAIYFQMKGIGMALIIAYGVLNVMSLPCLSAISQDVAPAAQKGLVWGLMVFCMYVFGGGWSPYLVGAISNALGQGAQALGTALTIASTGGILGGICYFMASRPYPADMDRVKGEHEQLLAEK
jgi:MFS family permease